METLLSALSLTSLHSGAYSGKGWIAKPSGKELVSFTPIDGSEIARVQQASKADYETIVAEAEKTFRCWRMVPAPQRGELIRKIGNKLREKKKLLGKLVSLEMGKILAEGEGEVQEMIDIADFSVGLSRQLYGFTMHSERPKHRMYEQWHPLGTIGVISAFNFPVAVWAWNAFVAAVCGDTVIWKPSHKTPLTAIAVQHIVNEVMNDAGFPGVFSLVIGDNHDVGETMIADRRLPLISATGSCRMGRRIGAVVAERLGRSLLELGGNNAIIVMKDANLDLAARAIVFGSVGTAGQRCTSTRRVIMEQGLEKELTDRLLAAYKQIRIGSPLEPTTLMGPLIDTDAVNTMMTAIEQIKKDGGEILVGGNKLTGKDYPGGCYVEPTIVRAKRDLAMVKEETFAPILYLLTAKNLEEAIEMQNDVPQGLSSSIFTNSMMASETFLSHKGSDCGIANVNIGTSGAEIGGAFGGEKDTGGGRESGSDSWKAYMRRQTNTINWSTELPLAQGLRFDIF
ncbi:MAG: aldehyde dehydrogenase family protein [Deltaproteobacteria bacterium]|nr:aldehyde dehydrogenase family protein [Deltaproteobacteria bacterium]